MTFLRLASLTLFGALWFTGLVTGQVYRPVAPPAPQLRGGTSEPTFDPYSGNASQEGELRLWQTLDIPIGSWGDPGIWNPDQLNGTTISRFRKAFVQKVELTGGFVSRSGMDDIGYSWADAGITMVVPLGSTDNLLVLTPRYQADWIDGPAAVDVPSFLQGISMDVGLRKVFSDQWSFIGGVQPGYFNDRYADSSGFRMGALALLSYQIIPEKLTFTFGVVYLDQNDYPFVPGVGLTWIPDGNTRYDLNFPKPKISKRVSHIPTELEDWVYIAGSFGGGTWAVLRENGMQDELTLRDFRLSIGFERLLNGGTGFNVDIGYVFGRDLEYASNQVEIDFDDSFLIETGLRF